MPQRTNAECRSRSQTSAPPSEVDSDDEPADDRGRTPLAYLCSRLRSCLTPVHNLLKLPADVESTSESSSPDSGSMRMTPLMPFRPGATPHSLRPSVSRTARPSGRSDCAAECIRRIRKSRDGGESEMDKQVMPGTALTRRGPDATGFTAWSRDGESRGTALWAVPADAEDCGDRILFLHGGGYLYYSPHDVYQPLASRLAHATGMPVFCPDYRLAPEHPFPAALVDAQAALRWLAKNGPDGPSPHRRLFVFGDSAGGGLALSLAISLAAHRTMPPLSGVATISAYTDLTHSGESYHTRAWDEGLEVGDPVFSWGDPSLERERNCSMARQYYATRDPRDPLVSPYFATTEQLRMLPPTLMMVGNEEQMLSDTVDFAKRAHAAGGPIGWVVFDHMWHDWVCYAGEGCGQGEELSEGTEALRRTSAFFNEAPARARA